MLTTTRHSVRIPPDRDGFTGRECPIPDCERYFKVEFGTGLKGSNPCHCPYCGHVAPHDRFWTKEQIAYAKSVVFNEFTKSVLGQLKRLERRPDPHAFLSLSIKVEGRPHPIRHYREQALEQTVVCDQCTLRYAIYGAFGYCPDCGVHNSLQILEANLGIVEKMVQLSQEAPAEIAPKLVENALEDAVSSMDGFGREVCRVFAAKASDPSRAGALSFQAIEKARDNTRALFGVDLAQPVTPDEWAAVLRSFQKRHLLAHRMGVVDQTYLDRTGEPGSLLGRRITILPEEVSALARALRAIGGHLFGSLSA